MKTKKFLNNLKTVKKTGVNNVVNSLIRSGSAVGAGMASTVIGDKLSEKIPMIGKIKGPALFGLGLLGEVFLSNEKLKAVAAGASTWGAIETTRMLLPEAQKTLLSFGDETVIPDTTTDAAPNNANGVTGFGNPEDWRNAYKAAEDAVNSGSGTNGIGEASDITKVI